MRVARPNNKPQRRERAAADQERAEPPIATSSEGHRVDGWSGALVQLLETRAYECDTRRSDGLCGFLSTTATPRQRARASL